MNYTNKTSGLFIKQLLLSLTVILFSMNIINCSSSNSYKPEKMDAALQQKINSTDEENSDTPISFMGKCSSRINSAMEERIRSAGVNVESIVDKIFTATGKPGDVKKVSLIEYVVFLELAKKMDLK